MGSSIRRQRSAHVHFLLEVAFIVAADIPLVALVGLYQLSFRCHDGCSSQLDALSSKAVERVPVGRQRDELNPNPSRDRG
jgi:hypothetical protein